ncbi:MAG: hypothetical protein QOJ35_3675, partial [Solirubrobacteraceae bacterium]|nr:hypothetical protein [Solirubrobacteraceae bacterium]
MATIEDLNDRQRAVLQLLLKQGKSYDEIAALLRSDASAVQGRAHEAVQALGPGGPDIGEDRRREIADYLLGQQSASRRAATREYLEGSADGRGWARSVAGALRPIAGDALPDVPAEPQEVDQAFEALDKRAARRQEVQRSSQLGTRILIGGLALLIAIGLVVVLGVFSGDAPKPRTATVTRTAATTPRETPQIVLQGTMRPPGGGGSTASAETAIVRYASNNRFRLLIAAKGLPQPPSGSAYAVWLYTSADEKLFIGFPKATVSDTGSLDVVADLTPQTPRYAEVLLTRERVAQPKKPGQIVLRGTLQVPQQPAGSQT